MHQLVASPQDGKFVMVRPGARGGIQLPFAFYRELGTAVAERSPVPEWLVGAARQAWGLELEHRSSEQVVLVRSQTPLNYSRATWEINRGCNFACDHCVVWKRPFEGLSPADKGRLLELLRGAGVLWLQFTGGEPTIDPDFPVAYRQAYGIGMMLEILTNGTRLAHKPTLDLLSTLPPHKITVSLYGATADSFDALTRKRGAFNRVMKGLAAAREARLPLDLSLIITRHNAHEAAAMRRLAEQYATRYKEFANISPTYDGELGPLAAQAPEYVDRAGVFTGCPAGHTFFHVDPFGWATMCKVGRENPVDLMTEGLDGLLRLPAIADAQMLRSGGCNGCRLSETCRVCRPLAKLYQDAKAPLHTYCQHGFEDGETA
ncbi:radical SAM protein [Streptomyces sp. NBC_01235]|uniref:radical SAM protein n=1 Tax=Streptomyces sp. NBC_01235 TaxID=2903788 RepID=UPI002E15E3D9|nr:radical SAM protein [Streptomyces sp. NBC_01235]